MNDAQMPADDLPPAPEAVNDAGPVTAGRLLREARERMHVDAAVLATMLKVPEYKLRALEADQLDQLPDLTFARALAATICRTLQIEPAPVLALLPQASAAASASRSHASINTPYRTQSESTVVARTGSVLQSRYLWVVLAFLLAAVVLALLPSLDRLGLPQGQPEAVATAEPQSAPAPAEVSSAETDSAVQAVVPAAVASDTMEAAEAAASAPVATASEAASAPLSSDDLHLAAGQESWVQVRDATGKTLISRTLKAGESLGLTGQAPYRVVIGNIQQLSLQVRGQPFDFSTVTKSTTARFEVQ